MQYADKFKAYPSHFDYVRLRIKSSIYYDLYHKQLNLLNIESHIENYDINLIQNLLLILNLEW